MKLFSKGDRFWSEIYRYKGSATPYIVGRTAAFGVIALLVTAMHHHPAFNVAVPITPYEVLGAALGALLVLRTNAGYDRWWEARKLWGGIVNQCRNVIDTLSLARRKHPMGPNSLDALCKRYGIDNSHRTKHGALLDSELLAEVYIEMIGGRQAALGLAGPGQTSVEENDAAGVIVVGRPKPLAARVTEAERQAHEAMVAKIGSKALWARYQ